MNQEQLDVINTVQEVMRSLTLALCATNPEAMPRIAYALRAAAAASTASPMAAVMLNDLAKGVELFEAAPAKH
jgi:photosystem II stability/assembly factor-like uncharacterized protein